MTTSFRCLENEGNALFSCILHFMHVMVQTLFDEIVSTMAANRDPYSQPHAQAEITRDIEMSGQDPRKFFEDMHSILA